MKGRFIVNPFQELNLTSGDRTSLVELANQCITSHLELCVKFIESKGRVDPNHWKPLKEKEKLKVYSERAEGAAAAAASGDEPTGSGLPMIFCVGTKEGKLDDLIVLPISSPFDQCFRARTELGSKRRLAPKKLPLNDFSDAALDLEG
ncbi:hypothetical protein PRIC2_014072 [Phytophthora ramorum]